MYIYVLSKQDFVSTMIVKGVKDLTVESFEKTIFISINNSDSTDPYFSQPHKNVLTLYFDDVTEDYEVADIIKVGDSVGHVKRRLKSFSNENAKEILNFLSNNKEADTLIVHCSAGISRSGAVGTFINDMHFQNHFEFMKINPKVKPNPLVLKKLRDEHRKI